MRNEGDGFNAGIDGIDIQELCACVLWMTNATPACGAVCEHVLLLHEKTSEFLPGFLRGSGYMGFLYTAEK